jgi:quinol monooxygenase YgiN
MAHYTIDPGNEDAVFGLLAELEVASRQEPGNISFDAYARTADRGSVLLVEAYESAEAFAAHRETPHFVSLVLEQIVPLLSAREVESFAAVTT